MGLAFCQRLQIGDMRLSVKPFTNYMRYVVAILGCAGGALINFVEYDSFYSGGLHPLFLEMVYYVALIQFPIPTAILAERTSAKSLMIVTMILKFASLVLLETQQYVRESYSIAVIIGRILQAYATAAFPPIMYLFIGRWSPPKDRGIMAMIIFSGLPIGSMFRLAPFFLWVIFQMRTFYVFGALALLWIVLFWLLVEDHPEADHWVSQKERTIILEQLHRSEGEYLRKLQPFPFKEVFTSMPFWVLLAVHSGLEGAFTVLKLFPKSIETTEGGNFLTIILMIIFGSSVTCLVKRNKVNLTQARKSTVAFLLPTVVVPLLLMLNANGEYLVNLRSFALSHYGILYSGCLINYIDLAPKFAATLLSVSMTVATLVKIIFTYFFLFSSQHRQEWPQGWFYAADMLILFSIITTFYLCFASAEEQPWNNNPKRCGSKKGDAGHETLLPAPV